MSIILIVVSQIMVIVAIIFGLRQLRRKRTKAVLEKLQGKNILRVEPSANFFGQESLGMAQVRGNGVLVITDDELYFEMWRPKKAFTIPLSAILSIENPRTYLGKSKGFRLLRVNFQADTQNKDSAAWLIKELGACQKLLETLVKRGKL